jgi:hypothetical protein
MAIELINPATEAAPARCEAFSAKPVDEFTASISRELANIKTIWVGPAQVVAAE